MPSDHVVSTAELITDSPSIACPGLTCDVSSSGSSRLLDWIVGLTERVQRQLALAAEAEAAATGIALESMGRFANDAAGGGSRSIEAARFLRAEQV